MNLEPERLSIPILFGMERGFEVHVPGCPYPNPEEVQPGDIQSISRQKDRAFKLFVSCALLVAALVVLAIIFPWSL